MTTTQTKRAALLAALALAVLAVWLAGPSRADFYPMPPAYSVLPLPVEATP